MARVRECVSHSPEKILERSGRRRLGSASQHNAQREKCQLVCHRPNSALRPDVFNHLSGELPGWCTDRNSSYFPFAMTQDSPVGGATHSTPPDVIVRGDATGFLQHVTSGKYQLEVDEPANIGGSDRAPTPYDYLLAALGSCTSMTVSLYARGKKWPLKHVTVSLWHSRIHAKDCAECETKVGMLDRVEIQIELEGELTQTQRDKLIEIAGKCPVHRTLKSEIDVRKRGSGSPDTAASSE